VSGHRHLALLLAVASVTWADAAHADAHACVEAAHAGQRLRDDGKLGSAREAFLRCAVASCPELVRDSCERWAREIEPRVPDVVLAARDRAGHDLYEVKVTIDGKALVPRLDGRAVLVDPGPHELVFEARGFAPKREFFVAREGEKLRTLVVELDAERSAPPAAPPAAPAPIVAPSTGAPAAGASTTSGPPLVPVIAAASAMAIGAAGFAIFGLSGQSDRDRLESTCAPTRTCSEDDVSDARTKLIVADVSLLVGVAGAAVLGVLVLPRLLRDNSAAPTAMRGTPGGWSFGIAPVPGGVAGGFAIAR
jgi:hypothetical protein